MLYALTNAVKSEEDTYEYTSCVIDEPYTATESFGLCQGGIMGEGASSALVRFFEQGEDLVLTESRLKALK